MNTLQTAAAPVIRNREEAEAALALVAAFTIQLSKATNEQNSQLLAARTYDSKIAQLREHRSKFDAALEDWARRNRSDLTDKKSLEMRHGRIAFKDGPPKVQLLEGWTDKLVLAKLRKLPAAFRRFIRVKEEVDRQKILAEARPEKSQLDLKTMQRFGVAVVQQEYFSVEPKLESVEWVP